MVTLNCAGLPDSLLESELFGHTRGSFTGAYRDKPGLLEMAPNGTVFLDEVGEMSMRMQVLLLRFLETGEIQRVGADRSQARVNVRMVTATNRNLEAEVVNGTFREDLFFRLNVVRLIIPPLRERTDDIPALVNYYLSWYAQQHHIAAPTLATDALNALVAYKWPGNIRELRNVVERIVLKTSGKPIRYADLPPEVVRVSLLRAVPSAAVVKPAPSDELVTRMLKAGESFWASVYPLFMSRDLTRAELRRVIQIGLEQTNGNYRSLVQLFNMPPTDYKRFLSFLRKHDCHLPFQLFRSVPARLDVASKMLNAG
jgi:transcriptional regulator with GAF, ATPase, and Fis domain